LAACLVLAVYPVPGKIWTTGLAVLLVLGASAYDRDLGPFVSGTAAVLALALHTVHALAGLSWPVTAVVALGPGLLAAWLVLLLPIGAISADGRDLHDDA
jgi:hypothetical protein